MIELKNLVKKYKVGHNKPDVVALRGISLKLPDTGMVFVLGKSGSGKSTFLNVVGGLDSFEEGDLILFGKSARSFTANDYNSYRNKYVGFIFQEYNIINSFTVRRNVELAVELQNRTPDPQEVDRILSRVGLLELSDRLPSQLSGGQKQRIAIARALIKHPQIVLADEPTGALDSFNTKEIFELLREISQDRLVVCVTHDAACVEKYADRIIRVKDGRIVDDITRHSNDGVPVAGATGLTTLATGLVKIDDPQAMTDTDLTALKAATREATGPAYYAYGDHVRIPAELAEGDDSTDIPVGFEPTTEEDIAARSTKNRHFKYIKSHMLAKTTATFALGTLKHSPGRLAMTIILSLLSFTMLGVSTSISVYDAADAYADSARIYRPAASVLTKTISSDGTLPDQEDSNMLPADIQRIQEGYSDDAIPVYSTYRLALTNNVIDNSFEWFTPGLTGAAALTEDIDLGAYGFTLEGELPEPGEVVLTDYAMWTFERTGMTLDQEQIFAPGTQLTPADLIGKQVHTTTISSTESDDLFTISGILHTDIAEQQIEEELPKAQNNVVDASLLLRENWENGPSRVAFFNPADLKDQDTASMLGLTSIRRVLVPTPGEGRMRDLWHFTSKPYTASAEDQATVVTSGADYTSVSYAIDSSVVSTWLMSNTFQDTLSMVRSVAMWLALILAFIAILVTMNYLFTSVSFKIREIGILKGLGASAHEIFGIFVMEAVIIAAVNFSIACLVSWGLTSVVNSAFQTIFGIPLTIITFGWVPILVLFAIAFLVSIISVLIPSYTASSMKPADAMKRGLN